MTYTITSNCIGCDRCHSVCPTGAIQFDGNLSWIDATLCNNCAGFYSVPQCAASCPSNTSCVPSATDYWERWFKLYNRLVLKLTHKEQVEYWEQWFDRYSTQLTHIYSA